MPSSSKSSKKSVTKSSTKPRRNTTRRSRSGAITTYHAANRWLSEHADYERMRVVRYNTTQFSLDRMRKLLSLLGDPQKQLKCIHIAGTKGKGSTAAMLDSMLRECGYTVGLYTSPHLMDIRERVQVNGSMITQSDFTELCKLIESIEPKMEDDKPTHFEILTALSLKYFVDQAVDIAIIETGMGGRLDATNVIEPMICGITHISYDHMGILGKTLDKIAAEKAGIIKAGIPAISVEQDPVVSEVLRRRAEEVNTTLEFTGESIEFSYRFEANRELGPHTRVCIITERNRFEHLAVPLQGEHQAHNCGLALSILDRLALFGFETPEPQVVKGLAATRLTGRMEIVWPEPRIIVDGAHNAASIQALVKSIGAHVPYDSLVVIFGCSSDKDITGMLRELNLGGDKVIFTRAANNPRAADPHDLVNWFSELSDKMSQATENLKEALNIASRAVSREDLICVTGSFHLVGETKHYLANLATTRRTA